MSERTNVKVFIASSSELADERKESVMILAELNKLFPHLHLEPVLFEFDTESGNYPGSKRIQDEINPLLDDSVIVVVLFYSSIGVFTKEEFDRAIKSEKKVFLYLKTGFISDDPAKLQKYVELNIMRKNVEEESEIRYQRFDTLNNYNGQLYKDLEKYLHKKYPAIIEDKNAKEGIPSSLIPISPRPYIVHPYAMPLNFTGRIEEMNSLTEWFYLDRHHALYVLEAIGGMGKSSLTWKWMQDEILSKSVEIKGVVWWSFYHQGFDDFISHLYQYCVPEETRKNKKKTDEVTAISTALANQPYLIIIDGFERVLRGYGHLSAMYIQESGLSETEIVEAWDKHQRSPINLKTERFLESICSGKSKIIMTSRLYPAILEDLAGVKHVKLTGLSKADTIDFFKKEGILGSAEEIIKAAAVYGYHPLMLKLLSSSIGRSQSKDIGDAFRRNIINEKEPKKILQTSFEILNVEEQKVATILSVFRTTFDFEAACSLIPDLTKEDIWSILYELRSLGFIMYEEKEEKFDFHPVLRSFLYDQLSNKENIHELAISYFEAIPLVDKVLIIQDLQPTIELFYHLAHAKKFDRAYELYSNRLADQLYRELQHYGIIYELLSTLFENDDPEKTFLTENNNISFASLYLGYAYYHIGNSEQSLRFFKKHNEHCDDLICEAHQKDIFEGQGKILYVENRLRVLLKKTQQGWDKTSELKILGMLGILLHNRNKCDHLELIEKRMSNLFSMEVEMVDYEGQNLVHFLFPLRFRMAHSQKDYVKCQEIIDHISNFKIRGSNTNRYFYKALAYRGSIASGRQQFDDAQKIYEELIQHCRITNNQLIEYSYSLKLADLKLKQNLNSEVIQLIKEPLKYAEEDNQKEMHSHCLNILAELAKISGKRNEALKYANEAYKSACCGSEEFSFHEQLITSKNIIVELGGQIPYLTVSDDAKSYQPITETELNPKDDFHVNL